MPTKTICNNPICGEYGSTRSITDVDKINGWDNCMTCGMDLQEIEEDYDDEETHRYACANVGCISHGDQISLNLWQLEQCEDSCQVCGRVMEPFDSTFDLNLTSMDKLFLPDDISREDYMSKSSRASTFLGSCIGVANHIQNRFKGVRNRIVKKKFKYPVVFKSAGLLD